MTYPPQPPGPPGPHGPQGQQPPWGQSGPQGGGFPPSGPMPQQPPGGQPGPVQQFGQPGPYGQQAGGHPGYPGGPGGPPGPPGPPPKKKTGRWIGLSAAAVTVIAFVVTAFVAPGFLTGDDEPEAQQPGGTNQPRPSGATLPTGEAPAPETGGEQPPAPAPADDQAAVEELAQKLVDVYNNQDLDLAREIACNPSAIDENQLPPEDFTVELRGKPTVDGDTAEIPIRGTTSGGHTSETTLDAEKDPERGWCIAS